MKTQRTRTVDEKSSKRLIAHTDADGVAISYRVQIRISGEWAGVGNKMHAERPECDGLDLAWRVYAGLLA